MNHRLMRNVLPPLLTLLISGAAAEIIIRALKVQPILLPTPSAVLTAAWDSGDVLLPALGQTAIATLLGLLLSTIAGTLIAIALSTSRWVERAFYPYAIFFQVVPIVAIAPVLVIWFGIGIRSVTAAAFIVSVFPVIAGTLSGLLSVEPGWRDLFRVYQARRFETLVKLRMPAALPQMLTGLRIASGLAVVGAIVGEFAGGGGIGETLLTYMRAQRTDVVFAAIGYAAVLGLVLFGVVEAVSWLALRRWHASAQ